MCPPLKHFGLSSVLFQENSLLSIKLFELLKLDDRNKVSIQSSTDAYLISVLWIFGSIPTPLAFEQR